MLIQLGGRVAENENARRLTESNPLEYRGGKVSELRDGEVLHLVAHSGPGTFGGLRADQLFQRLRDGGLTPRIGGIQLHGCESSSSATTLSELVNARSPQWNPPIKNIEVRGVPGYHFVTSSGASWSVGAEHGNEELWKSISDSANRNPSDTNVERLAEDRDMIRIANLTTEASILRDLRDTVRDQLTQQVQAVAHRGASIVPEGKELESLERRIAAFVRLTGATVLGGYGTGQGLAMAQRAVTQGLEVLNGRLESLEREIVKVRAAHTTLLEIQQNLPDSIVGASRSQSLRKAGLLYDDLTLRLLLDAELEHLKDRPLATLRGIRFDEPKQQPKGPEVVQPVEIDDEFDVEALLAEVQQAKLEKLPPQ
jgi:hypothetical protein